jgi:hypothetical protein
VLLKDIKSATYMSRDCLQFLMPRKEEHEKVSCGKLTFVSGSDRRSGLADRNRHAQSSLATCHFLPSHFNPHSDRRPEAPQWINTTTIGQWSNEMPVIRQLPDSKRRSRTGCLPCRSRRRKCRTINLITRSLKTHIAYNTEFSRRRG